MKGTTGARPPPSAALAMAGPFGATLALFEKKLTPATIEREMFRFNGDRVESGP